MEKLAQIQQAIKAPKNMVNNFGKYKFRNVEGILEAAKKVMPEGCHIILEDEIIHVGDRFYVKATATFSDSNAKQSATATAYARECDHKKGMDDAQLTGACSSYARKYALGGLLAIDSTEDDPDQTNTHGKGKSDKVDMTDLRKAISSATQGFKNPALQTMILAKLGISSFSDIAKKDQKWIDNALKTIQSDDFQADIAVELA